MVWLRSSAVWVLIAILETLHGIGRTLLVQPYLGELRARQVGVFTGSLMILAIAVLLVRWIGARATSELLHVGILWVVLMVAFEMAVGRVLGMSWHRLAADYDPRQGGLMLLGIAVLLFAPLIAGRVRGVP